MKRIVICCDGTWNDLDYRARPLTNVVKLAQSVRFSDPAGIPQIVFYDEGVGTLEGEGMKGGAFGNGLVQNIMDAYTFLSFNYDPGDEIYIFGFSRGAYTARSLGGMIRNCGIVRRDRIGRVNDALTLYQDETIAPWDEPSVRFRQDNGYPGWWVDRGEEPDAAAAHPGRRLTVTYMGIWDTVGQLGVPNVIKALFRKEEEPGFHDLKLSGFVRRARHAVAIDEPRASFPSTPWDHAGLQALAAEAADDPERDGPEPAYMQRWFPGDHGSVGGGGDVTGLSDITLAWVAEGSRSNGAALAYDDAFSTVDYPVRLVTEAGEETEGAVKFQPDLAAALRNISADYQRRQARDDSVFGDIRRSVVSAALGLEGNDRLVELASLDELSTEAMRYAGEADYRELLRRRLFRHCPRIELSDVDALIARHAGD